MFVSSWAQCYLNRLIKCYKKKSNRPPEKKYDPVTGQTCDFHRLHYLVPSLLKKNPKIFEISLLILRSTLRLKLFKKEIFKLRRKYYNLTYLTIFPISMFLMLFPNHGAIVEVFKAQFM